jgi:hypothetical protein
MSPPSILRRLTNVSPFFNSLITIHSHTKNQVNISNHSEKKCHFISLWFEILTWFLVWECIVMRELKKGETFVSLLNIHGGGIRVGPPPLVFFFFFPLSFRVLRFPPGTIKHNTESSTPYLTFVVSHRLYMYRLMYTTTKWSHQRRHDPFAKTVSSENQTMWFISLCFEILTWFLVFGSLFFLTYYWGN